MTNLFQGLATGPIDHRATSVINAISDSEIDMGSVVLLVTTPPPTGELLPRVVATPGSVGSPLVYGIAVGGDADGIYGTGLPAIDDTERATTGAGQGVKVVTRGRCLARVKAVTSDVSITLNIGDPLTHGTGQNSLLDIAISGQTVIARALQTVQGGELAIIAVEVNYEGKL